jgi:hypothetical protein
LRKSHKNIFSDYYHKIESCNSTDIIPEVIEFEIQDQIRDFPKSGIWIIIAKPRSTIISEVRESISKKDMDNLCYLINPRSKAYVKTIDRYMADKKNFLKRNKSIFVLMELTYSHKTILYCQASIHHQNYIFTFVPYNGGNLSHKNFKITQYYKNECNEFFDKLILLQKPFLTNLEKTINQKVPAEVSQDNLGPTKNAASGDAIAMFVAKNFKHQYQEQPNKDTLQKQAQNTHENKTNRKKNNKYLIDHSHSNEDVFHLKNLDNHCSARELILLRSSLISRNLI